MSVIPVILLIFLIAPPVLLQIFDPEYRLQCTKEELGIRWPSYINSGNYYICQSERGNQLQISCSSGELFSFVLQICTSPEAHIPPPPLDVLPTSRPIISGPANEVLPIVPWLPKPLTPKDPLPEPPQVSASGGFQPPHVSGINEHHPPYNYQQRPQPSTIGQQQMAAEQQPILASEIPSPPSPIVKPPSISQGISVPKPSSIPNIPNDLQPPSESQSSLVPQPPPTLDPASVVQPPTVPQPPFVPQPPTVPQSASVPQPPPVPRPPLVHKPPVKKPKVPLPPTPPPTPPVVKIKKNAPGAVTKSKPPLPPKRKMPAIPVKRSKN